MNVLPMMRGRDPQGSGRFGASRDGGTRTHNGIDLVSNPGEMHMLSPGDPVRSLNDGIVTKLGYPYSHDLSFRYVEVKDVRGYRCRYFYVQPTVDLDDRIHAGDMLGTLQELPYPGITQHFHFEVMAGKTYHDPIAYLCGDLR